MEYSFLNSEKNDTFSMLSGIDLQELIFEIENYFLEYRDKLNLSNKLTFGVELETEKISSTLINNFVEKNLNEWTTDEDDSLNFGKEIISPKLCDDIKYWQELKLICDYLKKIKADTFHNAGGHIHISACVLGKDVEAWRNFIKVYTIYENILFRFAYGDKINGRNGLYKYASPIADYFYQNLDKLNKTKHIYKIRNILPIKRYLSINFNNVIFDDIENNSIKNTLEFRIPNASTNEVIWQNNINTFAKMLISSKAKVMNEDFLDYKLKNEYILFSENKYLYNEVCLKNALEFVDLIFDNNLDKIYFLRQYLKNFKEDYKSEVAKKAKKFFK